MSIVVWLLAPGKVAQLEMPKLSTRLLTRLPFAQPPQSFLTGGAQPREVDLNYVPNAVFPDGVVLVPQAVSESPYFPPGLTRHEGRGQVTQFGRGFANPFEAALNRIVCLLVLRERRQVHTGHVALNRLRVFDDVF
jgi:hypothetical protein